MILLIKCYQKHLFSHWKLNVSILTNVTVTQDLKQNLKEYFETNNKGKAIPSFL